jgi:hypothetical protein
MDGKSGKKKPPSSSPRGDPTVFAQGSSHLAPIRGIEPVTDAGEAAPIEDEAKRRRIESLKMELESLLGSLNSEDTTRVGTGISTPLPSSPLVRQRKIPALPEVQVRTLYAIKQHLARCKAILADHRIHDYESISVKSAVIETLKHCADAHVLGLSLIDEAWATFESSLVQAFGDPAKLRQEYDRAAGALSFSFQNPMQFMVGARNLGRLHAELNYSQPDFLRLLMGKCPKLLLTITVTALRIKREDWMSLPIDEIFDALSTAISTEAEVSAISQRPRSLGGSGVFRPALPAVNSIEEDPNHTQKPDIRDLPFSRYVSVREPEAMEALAKDADVSVLRKNLKGKWFMLVGFQDKSRFEDFLHNLDSAGIPHRQFEDRRGTGSKNVQRGH